MKPIFRVGHENLHLAVKATYSLLGDWLLLLLDHPSLLSLDRLPGSSIVTSHLAWWLWES